MKLLSKLTALLLCAVMVLALFASCADEKPNNTVVDPSKEKETKEDVPEFTEMDFGGETFTILSNQDEATDFIDHYIDNEERTGEPIIDAVVDRNTLVEDKYNVVVERKAEGVGYAANAAKSGTVDFQLVYDWGFRLVPSAIDGIFYDFNQLPEINLDREYWAPSAQDDLTIADKMLITTCDISMNRIAWAYFLFFNKHLLSDLQLEFPYTYVDQNQWTIDQFLNMVIGAEQDNGDTIWTSDDIYGSYGIGLGDFISAAGILGTVKNEDGTYTLDLMNEKIQQIYNNYAKRMATSSTFCTVTDDDWLDDVDQSAFDSRYKAIRWSAFGQEHVIFAKFSMDMTHEFTNMTPNSYGVVPMPKADSAQAEYFHVIDMCAPMFAIPKQGDLDFMGTILEYMAYESQQNVLPAFYEQTIKTKRMDDEEGRDERMLDIIRNSVHYSWTSLYYQGIKNEKGDGWDPCGTILNEMLAGGQFASVYKRFSAVAESSINELYDTILMMDVNK